ncbi:unnamed protein product [Soboliphyme baturini]|uniref:Transcriptional regulator n=1 Tax=Soboliphyme baturini TaxID=241478 RepID=A0A183IJ01_9BILA|nr:unnamed protein product [Soboliphyme baturini]
MGAKHQQVVLAKSITRGIYQRLSELSENGRPAFLNKCRSRPFIAKGDDGGLGAVMFRPEAATKLEAGVEM